MTALARPLPGLLRVDDRRAPIRAAIASLAPGGAERIVLEWLAAEVARGRDCELAVLHDRTHCLPLPPGVRVRTRGRETPEAFLRELCIAWRGHPAPVSCHLIGDDALAILWSAGLATVPFIHNARAGWRNDPACWPPAHVPAAIACAASVAREMQAHGCRVPVVPVRHEPAIARAAFDPQVRQALRRELAVADDVFLLGCIGALKPQKDYARAIEVLASLAGRRNAVLAIVGGALDAAGLAELDRVIARAMDLDVVDRLRLPGFARPIAPWLAAFDALLNVSRYEGLSMATREALAAGLPVVATRVGGQDEHNHARLIALPPDASAGTFADHLEALPVRATLVPSRAIRVPREGSLPLAARRIATPGAGACFVTANLNAGGAQRSLVNLACALGHDVEVAVCGESTQRAFADVLASRGIPAFRPAPDADPCAVAESLLARIAAAGTRTLCFWNADPRLKLLLAKHGPAQLRLVDASPGGYAFAELEDARDWSEAIGFAAADYYARLDLLVLKHATDAHPACREACVIPNGVATRATQWRRPAQPAFLVHGRIAPSKRIETIVAALALATARVSRISLHVVGSAEPRHAEYLARLERSARTLPIRLHGADASLAYLERPWTAAIVLGTHQGSPNAVLEAMAARVPVISNASGGTADMLDGGRCGWLLDEACTPQALADAMVEAADDAARAQSLAEQAHAHIQAAHGMAAMAHRYRAALLLECTAPHEKMAACPSLLQA